MKEVVYLVEKGWDYETVMKWSNHRRKAIVAISLENNPEVKDFDVAKYINRDFYLMTEEEKNKYFEKQRRKQQKQEKAESKLNQILKKDTSSATDKINEIKKKLSKQSL